MTHPTVVTVTRAELESGHWTAGTLTVRFAPDAFDAAGVLLDISATDKVHWSALSSYDDRLLHAYVERRWPTGDDRTFFMRQWLGEDPAILNRFITEVLPRLEVSFVGPEVDRHDPRLAP